MNKTIRRATTKDLIAITQLIAPFIDEFAINDSGRQLFCASMIEKMLENPEIHYFVYSDHQQMIGVIAYKNPAHLVHFFISKEKQAQYRKRSKLRELAEQCGTLSCRRCKSLVFQYLR